MIGEQTIVYFLIYLVLKERRSISYVAVAAVRETRGGKGTARHDMISGSTSSRPDCFVQDMYLFRYTYDIIHEVYIPPPPSGPFFMWTSVHRTCLFFIFI